MAVLLGALLVGCAGLGGPAALAPGTGAETLRARYGVPTARYALPGGAARLEYSGGTYGRQTWMFDVDANGALRKAVQVRSEPAFNAIRAGMTRDEVLLAIGGPSETGYIGWQKQTVWNYRYETPFCQWFQVGLGQDGVVHDTAYGLDPLCEHDDLSLLGPH